MSKDKLQICVSFKHTEEEEELYFYLIGQNDKSVFIKNLVRKHLNGNSSDTSFENDSPPTKKKDVPSKKISHGKQTKNKFLV